MSFSHFPDGRVPVLLSAHTEELLAAEATGIADYLDRCGAVGIGSVAAMLLRCVAVGGSGLWVRAHDAAELAAALRALAAGEEHPLVAVSARTAAPRTAFVFPGNGGQWPSMAPMYRQLPYRAAADRCADAFVAAGIDSPLAFLVDRPPPGLDPNPQSECTPRDAVGLASVWQALGIEPDATLGHSLGEIAAAAAAGAMSRWTRRSPWSSPGPGTGQPGRRRWRRGPGDERRRSAARGFERCRVDGTVRGQLVGIGRGLGPDRHRGPGRRPAVPRPPPASSP